MTSRHSRINPYRARYLQDRVPSQPPASYDAAVMVERRFCIAGIEVTLRSLQPRALDALAASYATCPPRGRAPGPAASADLMPDLMIDIEHVPDFARGRARSPTYPAFDAQLRSPRHVALSRFDAEGELVLPDSPGGPVHGRFRVGDSPNSLEAAVRIGMSVTVPRRGGLLLHASAVRTQVGAAVFIGKSGAGKSTISAMLDGVPGITRLADELVIVMPARTPGATPAATPGATTDAPGATTGATTPGATPDAWCVHVPPFLGGVALPFGAHAPLTGVHVLVQAPQHQRALLPRTDAVRALLPHVLVYVAEPETAAHALAAAAALTAAVPCYRLEFAKDPGVARVLGIT